MKTVESCSILSLDPPPSTICEELSPDASVPSDGAPFMPSNPLSSDKELFLTEEGDLLPSSYFTTTDELDEELVSLPSSGNSPFSFQQANSPNYIFLDHAGETVCGRACA